MTTRLGLVRFGGMYCGLTAGPRTEGEVGEGGGREAWTNGGEVKEIKTCVNILQLNR